MSLKDILQASKIKAELEQTRKERDDLRAVLVDTERMELHELKQAIIQLEAQKAKAGNELEIQRAASAKEKQASEEQISLLNQQIAAKRQELVTLDDEILLQSFGFYRPRYDLQSSDAYRVRLEKIRDQQAEMVKSGKAALCPTTWTVNNSKTEGQRMIRDYTKLIVRSFNNECDASIVNVKFNNIESIEKKIRKAFDALNSLAKRMNISITPEYLHSKLEELHLCYEYQVKKQEEKEELRRTREEMREAAKVSKELEEQRAKLEKEQTHIRRALGAAVDRLQRATDEAERELIKQEIAKLEQTCSQVEKDMQDIQNREQNWRSGYVYIISNIGAFGEDVYKIGVTRRLDPQERIDELGDASVPFRFDVHAMIFSEDAPALETALHQAFDSQKLNKINSRKEFFRAKLEDIEQVVRNNHKKAVDWIRAPEAAEFRQSRVIGEDGHTS